MNAIPIVIIGIVAALLAFDKRYEDGFIGHTSLAAMVVASIIITFRPIWSDYQYDLSREVLILFWAIAGFLVRHAYRFYRFRIHGENDWTKQHKVKQ